MPHPPLLPPPADCDTWPTAEQCCAPWPVTFHCCCDWLTSEHPDWTPEREQLQQAALAWAESFIDTRTGGRYRRCAHRNVICLPNCAPPACDDCHQVEHIQLPSNNVTSIVEVWRSDGTPSTTNWVLQPPNILTAVGEPFDDRTIVVDYHTGIEPTTEALAAVAELACHRIRQCLGLDCQLAFDPTRIGRVKRGSNSRADVTVTGIAIVDMFLIDHATWAPKGWGDPVLHRTVGTNLT